jgi:hypothetical protein
LAYEDKFGASPQKKLNQFLDVLGAITWSLIPLALTGFVIIAGPTFFNVSVRDSRPLYIVATVFSVAALGYAVLVAVFVYRIGRGSTFKHPQADEH